MTLFMAAPSAATHPRANFEADGPSAQRAFHFTTKTCHFMTDGRANSHVCRASSAGRELVCVSSLICIKKSCGKGRDGRASVER